VQESIIIMRKNHSEKKTSAIYSQSKPTVLQKLVKQKHSLRHVLLPTFNHQLLSPHPMPPQTFAKIHFPTLSNLEDKKRQRQISKLTRKI